MVNILFINVSLHLPLCFIRIIYYFLIIYLFLIIYYLLMEEFRRA